MHRWAHIATLAILSSLCLCPAASAQWQANGVPMAPGQYLQVTPAMVSDGAGGSILVWAEGNRRSGLFAQHVDALGNVTWGAGGVKLPVTFAVDATNPRELGLLADGAGGAFVVFPRGGADGFRDLYALRVTAAGAPDAAWPAGGIALCAAVKEQRTPVLVTDDAGGFIAAWADARSGVAAPNDYDIYAQRVTAGGVPVWTPNGVPAGLTLAHQENPELIADGARGAFLTWDDFGARVYAQRLDSTGVRQWPLPGAVLCDSIGGTRFGTSIVSDGAGGAIVAWGPDTRLGSPSGDLFAQRVNSSGTAQWSANGVDFCSLPVTKTSPRSAADGAGGAFLAWSDFRAGANATAVVKRIGGTGAAVAGWGATGNAAGGMKSVARPVDPITDGSGGVLVAWDDDTTNGLLSDTTATVFAQHLTGGGAIAAGWASQGIAVCAAPHEQTECSLIPDGAGGGLVDWLDYRTWDGNFFDPISLLYVARVSGNGGLVEVPRMSPGAKLAVRVLANPARGVVTAEVDLPAGGAPGFVALLDVRGRMRERALLDASATGRVHIVFNAAGVLPPGLYFVRVARGGQAAASRVSILR